MGLFMLMYNSRRRKKMTEIIATAESLEQAEALLDVGVDTLYIGNETFGLRLPTSFSLEEIEQMTDMCYERGKKVYVAVNAIMHNEDIEKVIPYLKRLEALKVDAITVGDPGVIHLLNKEQIRLPFIYDAHTLVTSAGQINFWRKKGATGAVLARELTYEELKQISEKVTIPIEILVYGATCIHHSKRPLVENYFNFTDQKEDKSKERGLFLSESKKPDTHYSIYEDSQGTHVFATDDINLMKYVEDLYEANIKMWKLDGIFSPGQAFVEIAHLFVQAKELLDKNEWTEQMAVQFAEKVEQLHPQERTLTAGFFLKDPSEVQ